MREASDTTVALTLGTGPGDGATVAALRLAEEAIGRGHRVAVYAYGAGVRTAALGSSAAPHVAALMREGVHAGRVSWVVDREDFDECAAERQVPGVIPGDGGDLWRFVRDGDVVLGVSQ